MALPQTVVTTSSCSLLLIYRPQKDERLSWPSWLTYSRWFTHISGHPSAVGRAQVRESSLVKDQRSTAALRNQHVALRSPRVTLLIPQCHRILCTLVSNYTSIHGSLYRRLEITQYLTQTLNFITK